MARRIFFLLLFSAIGGCVEHYEFTVKDQAPSLVIEASLSDKSFNETLSYPSDGRFFTVKLTNTGDVTNTRSQPVRGASVQLLTDGGRIIPYTEVDRGQYALLDKAFSAQPGVKYKLRVILPDERTFESAWEMLPDVEVPEIGSIGFAEGTKLVYVREANEWVIRERKTLTTNISLPPNRNDKPLYYRWTYEPMWIYAAPLVAQSSPNGLCWATDPNYLNTHDLLVDRGGGYRKNLFEMETVRNARIYQKFSALIVQQVMTEPYYNFWYEMKSQVEGGALSDVPPYNLKSNFSAVGQDLRVSGYFGVVKEQARRWYFVKNELSYYVEDTTLKDCISIEDVAPECLNCLLYSFGEVTNIAPSWWQR